MDPDITFEFEGKKYTVSSRAYDVPYIVLPDSRLLQANAWLESYPPKPEGLHEVPSLFAVKMKPAALALTMNGVVAEEVVEEAKS